MSLEYSVFNKRLSVWPLHYAAWRRRDSKQTFRCDTVTCVDPERVQAICVSKFNWSRNGITYVQQLLRDEHYRDRSVGIATGCRLHGPGIEYRWGARFSRTGGGGKAAGA